MADKHATVQIGNVVVRADHMLEALTGQMSAHAQCLRDEVDALDMINPSTDWPTFLTGIARSRASASVLLSMIVASEELATIIASAP